MTMEQFEGKYHLNDYIIRNKDPFQFPIHSLLNSLEVLSLVTMELSYIIIFQKDQNVINPLR